MQVGPYIRLKKNLVRSLQSPSSSTYDRLLLPAPAAVPRLNSLSFGQRSTLILNEMNLPQLVVLPFRYFAYPVWNLLPEIFCDGFCCPSKADASSVKLCNLFFEHVNLKHTFSEAIYTDGAKDDRGVGCSAYIPRRTVARHLHSHSSIFTAELCAIQVALNIAEASRSFSIFSDSRAQYRPFAIMIVPIL